MNFARTPLERTSEEIFGIHDMMKKLNDDTKSKNYMKTKHLAEPIKFELDET